MIFLSKKTVAAGGGGVTMTVWDSSDYLDLQTEGLSTSGTAFTFAAKCKVPTGTLGTHYVMANGLDTYVRIQSDGKLGLRVEDTGGTVLWSADTGGTTVTNDDEFSFILAADQSQAEFTYAINGGSTTTSNTTFTTANNLDIPEYMNAVNGSGGLANDLKVDCVWAAESYIDPSTNWSDFFDGSNNPTTAMRNGSNIQSVAAAFAEGGNAAAWNGLTGMTGTVTDE